MGGRDYISAGDNPEIEGLDPAALYRRRQELLQELGFLDLEFDRRRQTRKHHVKPADLSWVDLNTMTPSSAPIKFKMIISPELGFDIYNIHMFELEIAGGQDPETASYHRHGDAIKHYLSGRALERVGDETFEVEAGDFVHIPANVWHGTINPYDEPVRILAVQQFPGTYSQVSAPFIDRTERTN